MDEILVGIGLTNNRCWRRGFQCLEDTSLC